MSKYYKKATKSQKKAAHSKGRSTDSAGPSRLFSSVLIAAIALSPSSCRTQQQEAKAKTYDSIAATSKIETQMDLTMQGQGTDSATIQLDTTMIRQLPQGAAWTTTNGNATVKAQKTTYGLNITATATKTPKVTIQATTKAQNQQANTSSATSTAVTKGKPPDKRPQLTLIIQWGFITLNSLILARLLYSKKSKQ